MPPNSRDQLHWVNMRYGTSCRLFSIGKERKERKRGKGKKEGRRKASFGFYFLFLEGRHLVLLLFLYFFNYLLHSFTQHWETSKWKSVLDMDVYMGSGTGGYKDKSDILHSKCLSSKRSLSVSFRYVVLLWQMIPKSQWDNKDLFSFMLISPEDQLSCSFHSGTQPEAAAFIKSMPLTCQWEKEKGNWERKRQKMAIKGCVLISLAKASHVAEPAGKGAWMFSHKEALHMATVWGFWSSCSEGSK